MWFGGMIICSVVRDFSEIPRQTGFRGESRVVRGCFSPPRLFWRGFCRVFELSLPAKVVLAGYF